MLLCVISLNTGIPYQWTATGLNALVHIPMYYYYLLALFGKSVWWKKYMTLFQIIQFIMDTSVCLASYLWNRSIQSQGKTCSSWDIPWANPLSCGIVLSYLLLFIEFFIKTYISRQPQRGKKD